MGSHSGDDGFGTIMRGIYMYLYTHLGLFTATTEWEGGGRRKGASAEKEELSTYIHACMHAYLQTYIVL
jgi:hypothetical protein